MRAETRVGFHATVRYFCPILIETGIVRQQLVNLSHIEFRIICTTVYTFLPV
jgi:hypothetical protein